MKRSLCLLFIAFSLVACSEQRAPQDDVLPEWAVVAADAVSFSELSLRGWCDPATRLPCVASSSQSLLDGLRASAAKVRSAGVAARDGRLSVAYDDLVALAEYAAALHHLTRLVTRDGFFRQEDATAQFTRLSLTHKAMIFELLTHEERDKMRAGEDVSEYQRRALNQLLERQVADVSTAKASVSQARNLIVTRSGAPSVDGPSLVVDASVVTRSAACVIALVDDRLAVK